jgi:hypothetical protein
MNGWEDSYWEIDGTTTLVDFYVSKYEPGYTLYKQVIVFEEAGHCVTAKLMDEIGPLPARCAYIPGIVLDDQCVVEILLAPIILTEEELAACDLAIEQLLYRGLELE